LLGVCRVVDQRGSEGLGLCGVFLGLLLIVGNRRGTSQRTAER
jgi:hypothetical protein